MSATGGICSIAEEESEKPWPACLPAYTGLIWWQLFIRKYQGIRAECVAPKLSGKPTILGHQINTDWTKALPQLYNNWMQLYLSVRHNQHFWVSRIGHINNTFHPINVKKNGNSIMRWPIRKE